MANSPKGLQQLMDKLNRSLAREFGMKINVKKDKGARR